MHSLCSFSLRFASDAKLLDALAAIGSSLVTAAQYAKKQDCNLLPYHPESSGDSTGPSTYRLIVSLTFMGLQQTLSSQAPKFTRLNLLLSTLSSLHNIYPEAGLCPVIVQTLFSFLSAVGEMQLSESTAIILATLQQLTTSCSSDEVLPASIKHTLTVLRSFPPQIIYGVN